MPVDSVAIREKSISLRNKALRSSHSIRTLLVVNVNALSEWITLKAGETAAGLLGMLTKERRCPCTGYFGNSVNSLRVAGFVEELKQSFPQLKLTGVQRQF